MSDSPNRTHGSDSPPAPKSLLDLVDDAAYLKDATFAAYMATRDDASCGEQVTQALRWLTHQTHEMAHDLHQALNALHEASRDGAKPPQDQDRPAASSPPLNCRGDQRPDHPVRTEKRS